MSGQGVSDLQTYLANLNIYPKSLVTGYFGRITELSVKVFQLENGISPTGTLGPKTRARIQSLVDAQATTVSKPAILAATSTPPMPIASASTTDLSQYSIHPRPAYDLKKMAKDIQNLINDQRADYGLNPIYWDDDLAEAAQEHSDDQARDNVETTDPDSPCHYPLIRHEGMTPAGYSLKDRYSSANIKYVYGGENIAMVPMDKNLLYLQLNDRPAIKCPEITKYDVETGPESVKLPLFQKALEDSKVAIQSVPKVSWVNKEWSSEPELEEMVVAGWMNSPGHRDNILRKEYTVAGIGITMVNDDMIVTHDFAGR